MPPKKPRKKPASAGNTTTIALSSLHLRLENLESEHQNLLKKIQKKRTELNNFVEQLRAIALELFQRTSPILEKMFNVSKEIHELFQEILSSKKLGKQARKKIENIYDSLHEMGLINSPDSEDEEEDEELDELFENDEEDEQYASYRGSRDDFPDNFEKTAQKKTEETRHIRQTFLRLAEIFHPDKASDLETQKHHTEIMKEINRAYQDKDFAKLLEIEKKHFAGQTISLDNTDDLTRQCEQLEKANAVLKKQYELLLEELRLVRNTPEGAMVTDYRRAKRENVDLIDLMLQKLQNQVNLTEEVRDFVKSFRNQKISLSEFVRGPSSVREAKERMMEELLAEMLDSLR